MSYEKVKAPNGERLVKITTPEGKEYVFRKLSTKPLDPKLKTEGHRRAKAMRNGFQKAVKKAAAQGVPLQKVVPVS